MMSTVTYSTPVGILTVVLCETGVHKITFDEKVLDDSAMRISDEEVQQKTEASNKCAFVAGELLQWLRAYFTCDGKTPKLRLCPLERECNCLSDEEALTNKQAMVLQTLRERVPRGNVVTYEELGEMALNSRNLGRFVGTCMRRNSIPLLVPCHRVIGSNANTRYKFAGRNCCQLKEQLLEMEKRSRM